MNSYLRNILTVFLVLTGLWLSASAQWSPDRYPQNRRQGYWSDRLSGTWRLNASRGDDPRVVAERATRSFDVDVNDRQRAQEILMRRLDAPRDLAIDRRGRTVTMASSRAPQVTFEANGIEMSETSPGGRQRHTRAMLYGDRLTVRTVGDRGSDYEVVFEPREGGRGLGGAGSLYTDGLNEAAVRGTAYA